MTICGHSLICNLLAWTEELEGRPFQWGELDCNTLALAWLDRLAGTVEFAKVQGRYATEEEARAFQERYGLTVRDVLAGAGAVEVHGGKNFAQPGDFLLVEDTDEPWWRCHICTGPDFLSVWPGEGVKRFPMSKLPDDALVMRRFPCLP